MTLDLKRLIAVMGMTGSVGDGEALNAVRLANRMLKAAGKNWSDVLSHAQMDIRVSGGSTPDYRTPPSKRKAGAYGRAAPRRRHEPDKGRNVGDDIGTMLGDLSSRRHDMSTMMFLASLSEQWERKSYLTDAQYDALRQMHTRGRF